MRYSLDTNVIINILKGNTDLAQKIEDMGGEKVITPIVMCELLRGAYLCNDKDETLALIKEFIEGIEVIDFTMEACESYGENYAALMKKGRPTQEFDLLIGCVTLAHGATLITHNHKDFSNIKGLRVIGV